MSPKRIELWWATVLVSVLLIFPFFLNWILQKGAFVPVIGDSRTWLNFWATYVGAILTAIMVFATFLTIRMTGKMNTTRRKAEWLGAFRNAAADMVSAVDPTSVGHMTQDMNFWRFDCAVEKGHEMEMAVKRSSFLLSSVLREYDVVFNARHSDMYIEELNSHISPFLLATEEIIQFAIICRYLKEKIDDGLRSGGVEAISKMANDMENKGFFIIKEAIQSIAINKDNAEIVVHDAVVRLQQNLAKLDTDGLEKLLLQIGSQNAKKAYGDEVKE